MQEIVLEAEKRVIATKEPYRCSENRTDSAVAYGDGDPLPLSINEKAYACLAFGT